MEKKSDVVKEEEEEVLPGFRFHPTDEELVGFYLRRKVEKKPLSIEIIKEMDIYKYDPWDLPRACSIGSKEKEWYFFCLRGRKYRNNIRPNRVTGSGFWKPGQRQLEKGGGGLEGLAAGAASAGGGRAREGGGGAEPLADQREKGGEVGRVIYLFF